VSALLALRRDVSREGLPQVQGGGESGLQKPQLARKTLNYMKKEREDYGKKKTAKSRVGDSHLNYYRYIFAF